MKREEVLTVARKCICTDRNVQHGPPEQSFGKIAGLWSIYLGLDVKPHDVGAMMVLFKIARSSANPLNADNWVDAAGYAACASEVAVANFGNK